MDTLKTIWYVLPVYLMFNNSSFHQHFMHRYGNTKRAVQIHTNAEFGSSAINTLFIHQFLTGNYLDESLKNSVSDRLFSSNRFGLDWNSEVGYFNMNDSLIGKGWGFYAGFKNRLYAEGNFSRDLFRLAFYGNKEFAGDTAHLSGTAASLMMYQQFQIGFIKNWIRPSSAHTLGFALSYVNGNFYNNASLQRFTLFTEANAEYIDVNANASLNFQKPEDFTFFKNNGTGLSLDLDYQYSWGKNTVSFQAHDIGFIYWSRPLQSYRIDSTLLFTGVEISNVFSNPGESFSQLVDSLDQYYLKREDQTMGYMFLPVQFHAAYTRFFLDNRIVLQCGVNARISQSYFPYTYARGIFYPHSRLMIGTSLGYGGFGTLNVGFELGVDFGKGYTMILHTKNLEGIIPNTFSTGLSAGLKLSRNF
jgi:hypothetical protein